MKCCHQTLISCPWKQFDCHNCSTQKPIISICSRLATNKSAKDHFYNLLWSFWVINQQRHLIPITGRHCHRHKYTDVERGQGHRCFLKTTPCTDITEGCTSSNKQVLPFSSQRTVPTRRMWGDPGGLSDRRKSHPPIGTVEMERSKDNKESISYKATACQAFTKNRQKHNSWCVRARSCAERICLAGAWRLKQTETPSIFCASVGVIGRGFNNRTILGTQQTWKSSLGFCVWRERGNEYQVWGW